MMGRIGTSIPDNQWAEIIRLKKTRFDFFATARDVASSRGIGSCVSSSDRLMDRPRAPEDGGLPGQDHVLPAERQLAEMVLPTAKISQAMWKNEGEIGQNRVKACLLDQSASLSGPKKLRVTVKRHFAHDPPCAGVPRVIFPKGEPSSGTNRRVNEGQGIGPLARWNVMERSVGKGQVERLVRDKIVGGNELGPARTVVFSGPLNRIGGDVNADKLFHAEDIEEMRCGVPDAATEIKQQRGRLVKLSQTARQPVEPAAGKILFVLSNEGQTTMQGSIVVVGEDIELGRRG